MATQMYPQFLSLEAFDDIASKWLAETRYLPATAGGVNIQTSINMIKYINEYIYYIYVYIYISHVHSFFDDKSACTSVHIILWRLAKSIPWGAEQPAGMLTDATCGPSSRPDRKPSPEHRAIITSITKSRRCQPSRIKMRIKPCEIDWTLQKIH